MEPSIITLNETDQAAKQMLQAVVKRKAKFKKMKHNHLLALWACMAVSSMFLLYIYYFVAKPYSYSFFAMFSAFINDPLHFFYLASSIGLYGYMLVLKKKTDKAEKEFHALRCEIIDKSKHLWKQESAWKQRHLVFEMMKKEFDINLYHENK
ncbi:YpbF family protein [Peribacillus sp. SCS-26]|uniref:YpbF family protein n=1 Tax=Paraperibacillus marinus TaxID=3115295 RepID=UPI003906B7F3